jgi:hypothetical protein
VVIKQVRDVWAANAKSRVEALKREAAAGLRAVIENPFAAYLLRDYVPGRSMDQATNVDALACMPM